MTVSLGELLTYIHSIYITYIIDDKNRGRFGCQMSGQGKHYIVHKIRCCITADPLPNFTCVSLMHMR